MAIEREHQINEEEINQSFVNRVINCILEGAYTLANPPYYKGRQCVPSEMLGNINMYPDLGDQNSGISATWIYNQLLYLTSVLTRVGTFTHRRIFQTDYGNRLVGQTSGKCVFNDSAIRNIQGLNNAGVSLNNPITADSINQLIINCLTAYQSTEKFSYDGEYVFCHSVCHGNCYGNCHNTCYDNCYTNNPGGTKCHHNFCYWNAVGYCHINCHSSCYADTQ